MKVIGLDGQGNYIAIVSHTELEKLTNKYYGKLEKMRIGSELNLGAGYDFTSNITSACKGMVDSAKAFKAAQESMLNFSVMVSELPSQDVQP